MEVEACLGRCAGGQDLRSNRCSVTERLGSRGTLSLWKHPRVYLEDPFWKGDGQSSHGMALEGKMESLSSLAAAWGLEDELCK